MDVFLNLQHSFFVNFNAGHHVLRLRRLWWPGQGGQERQEESLPRGSGRPDQSRYGGLRQRQDHQE